MELMKLRRSTFLFLVFVFLANFTSFQTMAGDHGSFNAILNEYVEGGYFDYEAFMEDRSARDGLDQYLSEMSRVKTDKLNRDEELAYWMNLYNASTIQLIEKNYPVESINDLGGWLTSPFEKEFIETQRGTISLDAVEHEIIRPTFDEPRIHFALVCAAKSCPPLRNEAYVADQLDDQLEDQTKEFLSSEKNNFILKNRRLNMKISSIFHWYGEDFGGEAGIAQYVAEYLPEKKAKPILNDNYTIEYLDYNWELNQAPGPYQTE